MSKHKIFPSSAAVPIEDAGHTVHFKNEAGRRKAETELGPDVTAQNVLDALQNKDGPLSPETRTKLTNSIRIVPVKRGISNGFITQMRGDQKRQQRRIEAANAAVLAGTPVSAEIISNIKDEIETGNA